MKLGLHGLIALGLTLAPCYARALEVERSEARFADQRYSFDMVVTLDAPIDRIDAVLKDYAAYPTLDPRILESRVLERPSANEVLLYTALRACFGPFCRSVKRVERVQEQLHELHASTLPERSDVVYGETFTQLSNAGERTRVTYRTTVSPDFWIPRFVGRRLMLNTLRDATLNMFGNIEQRAGAALPMGQVQPDSASVLPQ
jgi:hypothetical protein